MAKFERASERWRLLFARPDLLEAHEEEDAQWRVVRSWLEGRRRPAVSRRIELRARPDAPREPGRPCPCCFEVVDSWQALVACSECLVVYHAACAGVHEPCPRCGVTGDPPPPPSLPWNDVAPAIQA
ncbi:MAG: hypothetical protein KDD82_13430 [Planctomycetes bacterium]|nr:hypothetical protein [Planctomycetota bacterium]